MMISEDKLIVILSPQSKNHITEGLLVLTTVIVNSTEMRFQLNVWSATSSLRDISDADIQNAQDELPWEVES